MRVEIIQIGQRYQAKILDGHRTGEFIRATTNDDAALYDVDRARFVAWLADVGYLVINP